MKKWNKKIRLNESVVLKSRGKEAIILDLEGEVYHGLNASGATMLNTVLDASNAEEGYEQVLKVYDAEPSRIRNDLEHLLTELAEKNIIEWID